MLDMRLVSGMIKTIQEYNMRFNKFDANMALLAKQSVRDGEQRYTEDQIRSMVGAPSIEESQHCICGEPLNSSHMACYEHMSSGY
jgi:hypothetical protein